MNGWHQGTHRDRELELIASDGKTHCTKVHFTTDLAKEVWYGMQPGQHVRCYLETRSHSRPTGAHVYLSYVLPANQAGGRERGAGVDRSPCHVSDCRSSCTSERVMLYENTPWCSYHRALPHCAEPRCLERQELTQLALVSNRDVHYCKKHQPDVEKHADPEDDLVRGTLPRPEIETDHEASILSRVYAWAHSTVVADATKKKDAEPDWEACFAALGTPIGGITSSCFTCGADECFWHDSHCGGSECSSCHELWRLVPTALCKDYEWQKNFGFKIKYDVLQAHETKDVPALALAEWAAEYFLTWAQCSTGAAKQAAVRSRDGGWALLYYRLTAPPRGPLSETFKDLTDCRQLDALKPPPIAHLVWRPQLSGVARIRSSVAFLEILFIH